MWQARRQVRMESNDSDSEMSYKMVVVVVVAGAQRHQLDTTGPHGIAHGRWPQEHEGDRDRITYFRLLQRALRPGDPL